MNQNISEIDPNIMAVKIGEIMMSRDPVANQLGMKIDEIRAGYSRISMQVTQDMIGGHNLCHGGFTFTLADTACAYACNSRNVKTLSQSVNIIFLAPATLGEILIAEALENACEGRTSTYEIKIKTEKNIVVAVAQAQCRTVRGQMFDGFTLKNL